MVTERFEKVHCKLIDAVNGLGPKASDIVPITIVSVSENIEGQIVLVEQGKCPSASVAARLRAAADHIEKQSS